MTLLKKPSHMVWRSAFQKCKVGRGRSRLKKNWAVLVAFPAVYLLTLNALAQKPVPLNELVLDDIGDNGGELSPRGATPQNVTPSSQNLPFGPSDVYNTKFSWQAIYMSSAAYSQYKQVGDTYLVDKNQCVFMTKFGLQTASTQFSGSCGDTCRWDASRTFVMDANADETYTKVVEKYSYGIAGLQFWDSMSWLDNTCMPKPAASDINPMPGEGVTKDSNMLPQQFGNLVLNYYFDATMGEPQQARLRQVLIDGMTQSSVVMWEPEKDTSSNQYQVQLSTASPNGWAQSVQMLGTQADYDASDQYILQLGLYYRLRSCSPITDYCTGNQIYSALVSKHQAIGALDVSISADNQEVTLALTQAEMLSGSSCKMFWPTIQWSHDYKLPADIKITSNFDGQKIIVKITNFNPVPDCTKVKVNAIIRPLALSSAGDDYDTTSAGPKFLELTYLKSCPTQGGTITTSIKPSMSINDTKFTITITLPQTGAILDKGFMDASGTTPDLLNAYQTEAGTETQITAPCCIQWAPVPSSTMEADYEINTSNEQATGIKFKKANQLVPGKYTLKVQFTLKTTNPQKVSSSFDIEVTVKRAPVPELTGENVSPTNVRLPDTLHDSYQTGLTWSAYFTKPSSAAKLSDYTQNQRTQLVDPDTCLFYSYWSLIAPSVKYHATCGNTGARMELNSYKQADKVPTPYTEMTSIKPTDNSGSNTASWKVYPQVDSWLDSQCRPAQEGTLIHGSPVEDAGFTPNGIPQNIGFVFWFDKQSTQSVIPAHLKYTYYNDEIYGTVTSQDPNNDAGEYRIKISAAGNSWKSKVQLLGTQADYDEDGVNVVQFGIYYRLRYCTAMSTNSTPEKLCTGLQIAQELIQKHTLIVDQQPERISLTFSKSKLNVAVGDGCVVFHPGIQITNDYSGSGTVNVGFNFNDGTSIMRVINSGVNECTVVNLNMKVKVTARTVESLDYEQKNFAKLLFLTAAGHCNTDISSIAAKVQGHATDDKVLLKISHPQNVAQAEFTFKRSDGATTAVLEPEAIDGANPVTYVANCCVTWAIVPTSGQDTLENQIQLNTSGNTLLGFKFAHADTLVVGTFTVKVAVTALGTIDHTNADHEYKSASFNVEIVIEQASSGSVLVQPSSNYLPFAPASDPLGYNFRYELKYNKLELDFDISKYKKVHHTYLVDPETCVYLSKFGLVDPDKQKTQWKSGCGDSIRFSKNDFSKSSPDKEALTANVKPFESYERCLAGWSVYDEMSWLDGACVPQDPKGDPQAGEKHQITPSPAFMMNGVKFGFDFRFDDKYPHRAKLYESWYLKGYRQSVPAPSNNNKFRVKFKVSKDTFAQPDGLQLLGTQADYDESGNDVPVFGIYYRERNCTPGRVKQTNNICNAKTIAYNVLGGDISINIQQDHTEHKITVDLSAVLTNNNCLIFTPIFELNHDYTSSDASDVAVNLDFYDGEAKFTIDVNSNVPECTDIHVTIRVKAALHDYIVEGESLHYTKDQMMKLYVKKQCPLDSELHSIVVDAVEEWGKNTPLSLTLPYDPSGPSELSVDFKNSAGYVRKLEMRAFKANGEQISYSSPCCWGYPNFKSTTGIEPHFAEPIFDSGMITGIKFKDAHTLSMQEVTLAIAFKWDSKDGSKIESNTYSFKVKVACIPKAYDFQPAPSKLQINRGLSPIQPVNLPAGFKFIYLDSVGNPDTRDCIKTLSQTVTYRVSPAAQQLDLGLGFTQHSQSSSSTPTQLHVVNSASMMAASLGTHLVTFELLSQSGQSLHSEDWEIEIISNTAVDVTPSGLNHLPFGPEDVLKLGFSFEASWDKQQINSDFGGNLRGLNQTMLIDDTNCAFMSRFSLYNPRQPQTFDSSCGENVRLTPEILNTLSLSKESRNKIVSSYSKSDTGFAQHWQYSDGAGWIDSSCNKESSVEYKTGAIDLSTGLDFGFSFTLSKSAFEDTEFVTILGQTYYNSNSLTHRTSHTSFSGDFRITFKSSSSTFALPGGLQFLGTQAGWNTNNGEKGNKPQQFGIYYRTRQCTKGKIGVHDICTGQQIAEHLLRPKKFTTYGHLGDNGGGTVYIRTDRAALLTNQKCLAFHPRVTLTIPSKPQWMKNLTKLKLDFMDVKSELHIEYESSGTIPVCSVITVQATVKPFAFDNISYDYTMTSFYNLYSLDGCAIQGDGSLDQFELDLAEPNRGKDLYKSLQLTVNKGGIEASKEYAMVLNGKNVSFEAWINRSNHDRFTHDCCYEWVLSSTSTLWHFVEPVIHNTSKNQLVALKFHGLNGDLPEGTHELKIKVVAPAEKAFNINSQYVPKETNEVSIQVVVELDCQPVKYGFNSELSLNYDVNFDSVFPEVSLPKGLNFQYLLETGSVDSRDCLKTYSNNLAWTVSTSSKHINIDYENQSQAPSVIAPTWAKHHHAQPDEQIPVKIDLVHTGNSQVVLTKSITLTLKCSFQGQPSMTCPSITTLTYDMINWNQVTGYMTNHRVNACENNVKFGCLQKSVNPSSVTFDLCKASWFKGHKFQMPAMNNTAAHSTSQLEYPATYKLEVSATLGEDTRICPTFDVSVDLLDCSSASSYTNHTSNVQAANITATPPSSQKYTMGKSALTVTFAEFKIGLCKITGYTADFKTSTGESLSLTSITFDSSKRQFTVFGDANARDVVPAGQDKIDVVVEVTGRAGPNLSASMQFTISLTAIANAEEQQQIANLVNSLQGKPYFQILGSELNTAPLEISFGVNETRKEVDLGEIVYTGDPADRLSVKIPASSQASFAQIIAYSGGTYKLSLDLSKGVQAANFTYDKQVEVSILQAADSQTRVEKVKVHFILQFDEPVTQDAVSEDKDTKNETKSNNTDSGGSDDSTGASNSGAGSTGLGFTSTVDQNQQNSEKAPTNQFVKTWVVPPLEVKQFNEKIKKPALSKISSAGDLDIKFDSLRHIENENDWKKSQSRLLQGDTIQNRRGLQISNDGDTTKIYAPEKSGRVLPGFSLYIEPDEMSEPQQLNFKYKIKNFDNEGLSIGLEFDESMIISTNPEPEYLVVEMKDFRDPDGKLIVAEHQMRKPIPTQLDPGTAEAIEIVGATAGAGMGASFSFNVVLNLLVSQSLNQMLSSIKNLQVIVHLTLVNVIIPANATIFFSMIFQIIAFDPIDIEEYVVDFFELDGDAEPNDISPNFEQLGYESSFFMINMGSQIIIWILEFAQIPYYAFTYLLGLCICKQRCFNKSKTKLRGIFWNQLLALIDGTFLVIIIMAVINVREQINSHVEANISYWMSMIVIAGCLLEMLSVSFFLCNNFEKRLSEETNKSKCGYIYEELQYHIWGGWTLFYPILSQMRLLLIAYVTIYLMDVMVLQTLLVAFSTIVVLALVGFVHPVENSLGQVIDEFVVIIILDLLFFSSDPALDPNMRLYVGWLMIGILGISIIVNQGSLLVNSVIRMKRVCQRKWLLHKHKKAMERKGKAKESQVDKEILPQEFVETEIQYEDGHRANSRRRMMPSERRQQEQQKQRKRRSRTAAAYGDNVADHQDLNMSSIYLGIPLPEIEEVGYEDESQSNQRSAGANGTSRAHKQIFSGKMAPAGTKCKWCLMRDDGSQCILCDLKDEDEEKRQSQQQAKAMAKAQNQDDSELHISAIEDEIEQSERQSKLFSSQKLLLKDM